jgi:hypothetical protein
MVYAIMEATRESGKTCEWRIEMRGELFRLETKELEERCLKVINKANMRFWDKFVTCRYIKKIIL